MPPLGPTQREMSGGHGMLVTWNFGWELSLPCLDSALAR